MELIVSKHQPKDAEKQVALSLAFQDPTCLQMLYWAGRYSCLTAVLRRSHWRASGCQLWGQQPPLALGQSPLCS